jgi:flagellar basal body-associated protein FliL
MGISKLLRKGDLSSPLLAIIVTIGIIAAGVVVVSWFFTLSKAAEATPAIVVTGQPVVICRSGSSLALITVRNIGPKPVTVVAIHIGENSYTVNTQVNADEEKSIAAAGPACPAAWAGRVRGAIETTAGIYTATFAVFS